MAEDKDMALSLPPVPPAAPARREAAIEAALRRFDGAEERITGPASSRPIHWWTRINRPQLGALIAAGLVAFIFAPVAWRTSSQRTAPAEERIAHVRPQADLKTFDVAEAPPAAVLPLEPRAKAQPKMAFEPEASPPPAVADTAGTMTPQQAGIMTERRQVESAIHLEAPVVTAPMAAPGASARADNSSTLAQAAPASPPAAKAEAAAESPRYDVVVTAMRRSAVRGDWNACTINDPSHDLAKCRRLIDPNAEGPKGRAAAYVADGLTRAWQGDSDGAISAFDRAIAIAPKLSLAYLNRGLAYRQAGDLERAIADLDQAIRYAPQAARGYYNRSLLLLERGDKRRAGADEARTLDLDPDYGAVIE
jgi:tetratricopeptide (TPR) repeat protein